MLNKLCRYSLLAVVTIVFFSCNRKGYLFTSFHEPADAGLRMLYSYDGKKWTDIDTVLLKPAVGKQKVMRDPSMVQGPDGVFHLVWTSSWKGDKGFGYSSSKDLLHWTEQRFIPVMEYEPATVNVWAPELFYDSDNKDFIIIWASCIPGRFDRGIEDDSNNHRMYVTTTKDFNRFTPTRLFLDPQFSVIDAVIVKRAAQDYVLLLKDNTRPQRNLKVAFGKSPLGPWENISQGVTEKFTEGPGVVHLKDSWLIYFDSYQKKTYEAVQTTDFIHFSSADNLITVPKEHKHGTIVPVSKKTIKELLSKTQANK